MKAHKHTSLTPVEAVTISTLASKGLEVSEICELVDRSPATVQKAIAQGKQLLGAMVPEAAMAWRKAMHVASQRGFHQPAKELMEAAHAIERPQPKGTQQNVLQVQFIGGVSPMPLPGLPTPQGPIINVTPEGDR